MIPVCRSSRRKLNKVRPKLRPPKNTRCQPRICQPRILPERNSTCGDPPGTTKSNSRNDFKITIGENNMRKLLPFTSSILLAVLPLLAGVANASDQTKDDERLRNSGTVLKEILDVPEGIPQDLLDKADCVVVFPSVLKAAFIVGGSYGRGAMSCRK